jgi:hypothetical protein
MIRRSTDGRRRHAFESQVDQIQPIKEYVGFTYRVVGVDIVVKRFRQQRCFIIA